MGIILWASCEQCGFEMQLKADRGRRVSGPTCLAPALCKECNALQSLNYLKKKVKCKDCGGKITFYDEKALQERYLKADILSWGMDMDGNFVLPKAKFKCPGCGKFALRFAEIGFWD